MKKIKKPLSLTVAAVALSAALVACSDDAATPKKVDDNEAQAAETTEDEPEEEAAEEETDLSDEVFAVGDTIDIDGLEVTIESAEFVEPAEYSEPSEDKVLQMTVTGVNNRDESYYFDDMDFNLYDADGNALDKYFGFDDMDVASDLKKGKRVTGTLTYDVPEADSYELIYEDMSSWDELLVYWNIEAQ